MAGVVTLAIWTGGVGRTNAGPVNNGPENNRGGARNGRDSNPHDSPLTHLLADRQKRLEARRTMSDVVQLVLRHLYDSPRHTG